MNGERIRIPAGITKDVFYPTPVSKNNANARIASSKLTLDELVSIAKPIVEKYPDLRSNPLQKDQLKRILHDFPGFKGEQSVREKSDVVVQYYNGLIKAELQPAIESALKRKNGGRVTQSAFGSINSLEWQHLYNNASMISSYAYASQKAMAEAGARFGTTGSSSYSGAAGDGERGNSFQHAVWNCLIIREAMYKGYSKNNAILFTRNITSDHECDNNGNRQFNNHTAMDLHNNLSARSWFGNNSYGSVWPFSMNVPSEADIFSAWEHASTYRNFQVCNPATTLTSMFSWDFLYGEARAEMGDRLYFFLPLLPGC